MNQKPYKGDEPKHIKVMNKKPYKGNEPKTI